MGHDGLLPGSAAKIYPRFHTTYIATIVSGIFAAALAGLFRSGWSAPLPTSWRPSQCRYDIRTRPLTMR
jgi:APA family basic amino acid/polyamine antiporter